MIVTNNTSNIINRMGIMISPGETREVPGGGAQHVFIPPLAETESPAQPEKTRVLRKRLTKMATETK